MSAELLNSWKEIAAYTGRGIRTLQRWDRDLHFPVHHPHEAHCGVVSAFKDEIDLWFRTRHGEHSANSIHQDNYEARRLLLKNTQILKARASRMAECLDQLKSEIDRALSLSTDVHAACEASRARKQLPQLFPAGERARSLVNLPTKTRNAALAASTHS